MRPVQERQAGGAKLAGPHPQEAMGGSQRPESGLSMLLTFYRQWRGVLRLAF